MIPGGYDPSTRAGKIWWNENNEDMRQIWGTQETYDNFIKNGGTWEEYSKLALQRMRMSEIIKKDNNDELTYNSKKNKTR